jgi:hypothetical protein
MPIRGDLQFWKCKHCHGTGILRNPLRYCEQCDGSGNALVDGAEERHKRAIRDAQRNESPMVRRP